MLEESAVRSSQRLLRLRLGDHLIQTFTDSDVSTLQSAVNLVRTVFEDHYVDRDHRSSLFFHGCTIAGSHDFSVVHREGRVILSDFTFPWKGPACVSLPLQAYAREVIQFGENVLARSIRMQPMPGWQQRQVKANRAYLRELTAYGRRFWDAGVEQYPAYCEGFYQMHGRLKRPLEIQVNQLLEAAGPWKPVRVEARILFGPIRSGEMMPMRLNHGDVILVQVEKFTNSGVILTLQGVGSGGVRPGDQLFGLQLFYP
jgi:hypothetical protein